jgi:hypothetical protein
MKIFFVSNDKKNKYVGDSERLPIPRIGEFIDFGYNPLPEVIAVSYDYHLECVHIMVSGEIYNKVTP